MQKILFRGISTLTLDGEYGAYIRFKAADDKIYSAIAPEVDDGNHLLNDIYTVKEETIGQWTALYDKNMKKIFSGDILKDEKGKLHVVCRVPGGFSLQSTSGYRDNIVRFYNQLSDTKVLMWVRDSTEVVGNIFENAKLLKETEYAGAEKQKKKKG